MTKKNLFSAGLTRTFVDVEVIEVDPVHESVEQLVVAGRREVVLKSLSDVSVAGVEPDGDAIVARAARADVT